MQQQKEVPAQESQYSEVNAENIKDFM